MLTKKRGIVLAFLFLLILPSTLAALNITLSRINVSPSQPFDGALNLTFSTPLAKDTTLLFVVHTRRPNITLERALQGLDYDTMPAQYGRSGSTTSKANHSFTRAASQTRYAIDLSQNGIYDSDMITEIKTFNISIEGNAYNGIYPKTLRIDIGNDGTTEYTYKGAPKTTYTNINSNYLGNNQADSKVLITGSTTDVFCQALTLEPARAYRISAHIQKKDAGAKPLSLSLLTTLPASSDDLCTNEQPCCTVTTLSTASLTNQSCTISKDINERTPGYLCAFIKDGAEETEYYYLGQKTGNTNPNGYHSGTPSRIDYFLTAAYQDYEKELKTTVQTLISDAAVTALQHYKDTCSQTNCLLVPLNVSTESAGDITLKDLQVKLVAAGTQILTAFTPIKVFPERIAATSILLDLSTFPTIIAPSDLGTNREMYILFNGERSNTIRFNVVKGPEAVIKKNKAIIMRGESVTFDATQSKPINTSIKEYIWNFGDGEKGSGKIATHTYTKTGFYTISLKVVDAQNLAGVTTTPVQVKGEENVTIRITDLHDRISTLTNKIASNPALQRSADLLGITSTLTNARSNLTALASATEDEELLAERVNRLAATIPTDIGIVQSITYDPKITRANDVPTVLNTDSIDAFPERVIAAQTRATITGDVRLITLLYPDRDETFILITKEASTTNGALYESIPPTLTLKDHLTPIAEAISPTLTRYDTATFAYTLEGTTPEDLAKALQTKTFIIPTDLASVTPPAQPETNIGEAFTCGNNICEAGEDALSCPLDCGPQRPWLPIIGIGITALVLIAYITLSKGRYGFTNVFHTKKPGASRALFATDRDYLSVKHYIETSKQRGFSDDQIMLALKKKGWTSPQVTAVLKEAKSRKA